MSCSKKQDQLAVNVYETSASGHKLTLITEKVSFIKKETTLRLLPNEKFQTITGFGRRNQQLEHLTHFR